MIKPFTCVCLLAAAGSLLYLYQEKHASQLMDREVSGLMKQAGEVRERTGLMRAEYAMLNDPARLSQLAAQHLSLQPLAPGQFVKLADLGARLPGPVASAQEPAAMDDAPVAAAAPAQPTTFAAAAPAARVQPAAASAVVAAVAPVPRRIGKPHEELAATSVKMAVPPVRPSYASDSSALYAPVVPAFASQKPAQPIYPATMQHASAGLPEAPGYAPYVGSALGMAHATLAPPVPVSSATDLGASSGR